jgi:hypothetical protein
LSAVLGFDGCHCPEPVPERRAENMWKRHADDLLYASLSSHYSINQEDTVERKKLSNKADRWFPSGIFGSIFYFSSGISDFRQHEKTDYEL